MSEEFNENQEEFDSILDEYMAKLWSYNPDDPQLGMRNKEELQAIFTQAEFDFNPGAYQAGELIYLSYYGGRIAGAMQAENMKNAAARRAAAKEGKEVEESDKEKEEREAKQQLLEVTLNRLRVIHRGLKDWIENLDGLYYYRSTYTKMPYIDGRGRVFIFIVDDAIAKAKKRADASKNLELAYTDDIEHLSQVLYLNASEVIVVNDGLMPFEARRSDILPASKAETREDEDNKASDNNRALRYFVLLFHQTMLSPVPENADKEARQKALLSLEFQISIRLLKAITYFTVNNVGTEQISFVVVQDMQERHALAAYVDEESIPATHGQVTHRALPFFGIAKKLLVEMQNNATDIEGIVVNPGSLNFFINKEWLTRLDALAKFMTKNNPENTQGDPKED